MDPVTVRDSKDSSRGKFSQNGSKQFIYSIDSQLAAYVFRPTLSDLRRVD